jgi:TIGR03643 family protein
VKNNKIYQDIVGMAWSDKISFEEIEKKTGFSEKDVISLMRGSLKRNSYILWRKRVKGRPAKHRKLSKFRLLYPQK